MSVDSLLRTITERCDMEEVLDLAQVDIYELVEALRSNIMDNRGAFEDYLGIYEDKV